MHLMHSPPNLYILDAVRCPYVRNGGRGQLSSECRHNENDVRMAMAGLWRYGDWRHVATGYTAVVCLCTRRFTEEIVGKFS